MYRLLNQEVPPIATVQGGFPGASYVPYPAARSPRREAATPAVERSSSPLSSQVLGPPGPDNSDPRLGYHRAETSFGGDINTPPVFAPSPYLPALTTGQYELRDIPDFIAEAVSDFNGNPVDSTALSLRRGERVVVTMADRSGRWVLVRTLDGREGQVPMSSLRRLGGADGSSPPYPSAPPPAASHETPWDMPMMQAKILDLMSRIDKHERDLTTHHTGLAEHHGRLAEVEKRKPLRKRGLNLSRGAAARNLHPEKQIEWMTVALPPDIFSARFFLTDDSHSAKWFLLLAWITVLLEFGVAVIVFIYMATAETGSMDMIVFGSKVAAAIVSGLLVAKDVKENVAFAMVLFSGHGELVRVTLNDYILFPFRFTSVALVLLGNLWNILHARDALDVWKDLTAMTFVLSFPCQIWDAVLFGVCGEEMHEDALKIKDVDFQVKVEATSTAAGYYRLLQKLLPLITLVGMLAAVAYILIKKFEVVAETETPS